METNWFFYVVCVFGNDDKITHFINNVDSLSDAVAQADILKRKYDESYSIEVYSVEFNLEDKKYGVKFKKPFKEI